MEDALQIAIQANVPANSISSHGEMISSITWSPDSRYVLTTGDNSFAYIWDQSTGKRVSLLRGHTDSLTSAVWSSDSTRIVTTSEDDTARIWDAQSGRSLETIGHGSPVTGAAWSPNDSFIATSSEDGIRIWDVAKRVFVAPPTGRGERISRAAWSPDGSQFVTAGADGMVRIRDGATGALQNSPFAKRPQPALSASWGPNGRFILVAGGSADLLQVSNGMTVRSFPIPAQDVTNAAWSPSGRSLLTASKDGTTRIWNSSDGTLLGELRGIPQSAAVMAAWSPDGRRIAVGSADGTLRLYYVDFNDIVAQAKSLKTRDLDPGELDRVLNGQYVAPVTPTQNP